MVDQIGQQTPKQFHPSGDRYSSTKKMESDKRSELIDKLARIEVDMEVVRKRLPQEVMSLEKLLNSVDELNSLSRERDVVKADLQG